MDNQSHSGVSNVKFGSRNMALAVRHLSIYKSFTFLSSSVTPIKWVYSPADSVVGMAMRGKALSPLIDGISVLSGRCF